jgi:hypothetical protein
MIFECATDRGFVIRCFLVVTGVSTWEDVARDPSVGDCSASCANRVVRATGQAGGQATANNL